MIRILNDLYILTLEDSIWSYTNGQIPPHCFIGLSRQREVPIQLVGWPLVCSCVLQITCTGMFLLNVCVTARFETLDPFLNRLARF